MVWSSLKDIQAKKTSSKAYFQSLLHLTGKFYEIQDISRQFFFPNKSNIYEGLATFFLDKWEMVSAF